MDDEPKEIHWSNQLENLIAAEGEKARGLSWIHQRAETQYNTKNNYLSIPVIILSTLAGTASVGSTSLFPGAQQLGSIVIGLVSIGVGILNTISSYFSFGRKAEAHRIAHLHYSKLFSNIAVELSLPRDERQTPTEILKTLRDSMERLAETTPSAPPAILDDFNRRFKDEDKTISRPVETNGLQKIAVYRPEAATPKNIMLTVEDAKVLPQERRASSTRRRSRVDERSGTSTVKDDRDTIHRTPLEGKKDVEGGVQARPDAPPSTSDEQGKLQSTHPVVESVPESS